MHEKRLCFEQKNVVISLKFNTIQKEALKENFALFWKFFMCRFWPYEILKGKSNSRHWRQAMTNQYYLFRGCRNATIT